MPGTPSGGGVGIKPISQPHEHTLLPHAHVRSRGGGVLRGGSLPPAPPSHTLGNGRGSRATHFTCVGSTWTRHPSYPPRNPERVGGSPPSNRAPRLVLTLPKGGTNRWCRTLPRGFSGSPTGGGQGGELLRKYVRAWTTRVIGIITVRVPPPEKGGATALGQITGRLLVGRFAPGCS